jgi:thioesterase domain-containing protein
VTDERDRTFCTYWMATSSQKLYSLNIYYWYISSMNEHNPLIAIKQGGTSSKGAIFCIPGAGNGITSFLAFAERIRTDLPVFGLQPRGLVSNQVPYHSIEEMADIYVNAIHSKFPNSRYYLVGHSFGGSVALEIAKRLVALNCLVAPLILLDAAAPEKPHPQKNRVESLLSLIETLELSSSEPLNLPFEVLAPMDDETQLQLLHSRMVATKMLPRQINVDAIRGMVRLFIANGQMGYWPEAQYYGEGLLVNALDSKETELERLEGFERWRQFIPQLGYRESPGNHMTLLESKNILSLVPKIEQMWRLNI